MKAEGESYQELRDELDVILVRLQRGDLDVDAAAADYERGIELVKKLEKYVQMSENKIAKIRANFDAKKE